MWEKLLAYHTVIRDWGILKLHLSLATFWGNGPSQPGANCIESDSPVTWSVAAQGGPRVGQVARREKRSHPTMIWKDGWTSTPCKSTRKGAFGTSQPTTSRRWP